MRKYAGKTWNKIFGADAKSRGFKHEENFLHILQMPCEHWELIKFIATASDEELERDNFDSDLREMCQRIIKRNQIKK